MLVATAFCAEEIVLIQRLASLEALSGKGSAWAPLVAASGWIKLPLPKRAHGESLYAPFLMPRIAKTFSAALSCTETLSDQGDDRRNHR
jgi:hypothetical protein